MKKILLCVSVIFTFQIAQAQSFDEYLAELKSQANTQGDAQQAQSDWDDKSKSKKGDRACSSCHGLDLKVSGKHAKTKKEIKPMAASVNPERLTEVKKVKKWFKRNCEWAWGRECTTQEKLNFIAFLKAQ